MEDVLLLLNEWWRNDTISKDKAKGYRRKVFDEIRRTYSQYRQVVILTGLRRVGKSTMLYQLIEELLRMGVSPKNILYFSFDEIVEDPIKVLEEYARITKVDWKGDKVFLFLDEVHKLKNWSSKVKLLYDSLPNLKICVSGSASITVEKEAARDLAGRYFSFEVQPLTLQEFAELYFGKKMDNFELYQDKLKMVFKDYIRKPFPEIVNWNDLSKVNEYIKTLVIEKVVKVDISELFSGVNVSLLSTLVEMFMKDVGAIINFTSLAKDLGVHKLTLASHVKLLEYGKMIRIVKNYRPSIRAESRKLMKVYPYNIALSFCFYPNLTGGQILESSVASALNTNKYWRKNEREVDFLKVDGKIVPIEVKEKGKVESRDLRNLIWFMDKYKLSHGILVYQGKETVYRAEDKEVKLYPLLKLLFNPSLEESRN